MRRLLALVAVATLFSSTLSAQIVPGIQYSDLKYIYNAKEYKWNREDPYSPFLSAVGSFFIPGLGQFCCGERGRGLGMFAAGAAIDAAMIFSATQFVYYLNKDENGNLILDGEGGIFSNTQEASKWAGAFLGFGGAAIVYGVVCSIDAVSVAKVRNMYVRDLRKLTSLELDLRPTVYLAPNNNNATPVAGMALSVTF